MVCSTAVVIRQPRRKMMFVLDQNFAAAKELAKTYNWGAIYICDVSQRLADAIENSMNVPQGIPVAISTQ